MASIQARHSRGCHSKVAWTPASAPPADCTCQPTYNLIERGKRGNRTVRIGKNAALAQATLELYERKLDRERVASAVMARFPDAGKRFVGVDALYADAFRLGERFPQRRMPEAWRLYTAMLDEIRRSL